jgi:hypothetical protein
MPAQRLPAGPRWALLALESEKIMNDLDGCLRRIGATLIELGGSL